MSIVEKWRMSNILKRNWNAITDHVVSVQIVAEYDTLSG